MMTRLDCTVGGRKVAIIGAGYVGASIAYALTIREVAREIVLIDIDQEKARGEAEDIRHGIPFLGTANLYAGDYADCAGCDLIIVSAGRNRRPGETRLDMAGDNVEILRNVVANIRRYYTRGVILIISNPVDILVQKASEWMELPNGVVFGSGCMLDSSRLVRAIADHVSLNTGVISGFVAGEHGDCQVPIWSRVSVGGIPIAEYCENAGLPWTEAERAALAQRTRDMGGRIIRAKGKTHYGIATCVCYLADAVLGGRPTIASVCSPLQGEHGVKGVSLSVPSVVGINGVQLRLREKWTPEEYRGFFDAVESVRGVLAQVNA